MTLDPPDMEVLLRLGPPRHYVARLGAGGWSEAWGWSESEAVANLARALIEDPPEHLPLSGVDALPRVVAWLQSGYDVPIIDSPEP